MKHTPIQYGRVRFRNDNRSRSRIWTATLATMGLTFLLGFAIGCQREPEPTPNEPWPSEPAPMPTADGAARLSHESAGPSMAPHARIAPTPTSASASVPDVQLTESQAELCKVKTHDPMPSIQLPDPSGTMVDLSSLYGKHLTVVCFWKGDLAFARSELADLGPDVAKPFADQGVNVVSIAVKETPESAALYTQEAGFTYPTLVDHDGSAFELVGSETLPRTYLLDADGTIIWFDITYSRSTRRDLQKAIQAALTAG